MPADLRAFFDAIRPRLGAFGHEQVQGIERVLATCAAEGVTDARQVGYVLATAWHETGRRMVPVREGFAATDALARAAVAKLFRERKVRHNYALPALNGHSYYGRGLVQITHEHNYRTVGQALGVDLRGNPDLALDPIISARALVVGMARGLYTGKKLADFLGGSKCDFVGARRIINGTDRAEIIAGYARIFADGIAAGGQGG